MRLVSIASVLFFIMLARGCWCSEGRSSHMGQRMMVSAVTLGPNGWPGDFLESLIAIMDYFGLEQSYTSNCLKVQLVDGDICIISPVKENKNADNVADIGYQLWDKCEKAKRKKVTFYALQDVCVAFLEKI